MTTKKLNISDEYSVFVDGTNPSLSINKIGKPSQVSLNDTINYEINLTNVSQNKIENIIFYDYIPPNTEFVPKSFYYNGIFIDISPDELATGVLLVGALNIGESGKVTFQVKYTSVSAQKQLINTSKAIYNVIYEGGLTVQETSYSNEAIVYANESCFKQLMVGGIFCLCNYNHDISKIMDIEASVNIQDSKIITTPVGTSESGQNLAGKKLLLYCKLILKITYVASIYGLCDEPIYTAYEEVEFSTFIVLPEGFDDIYSLTPYFNIEDISYSQIDCRCLNYSVTMLAKSSI